MSDQPAAETKPAAEAKPSGKKKPLLLIIIIVAVVLAAVGGYEYYLHHRTVTTADGSITYTTNGNNTTVTGNNGSISTGTNLTLPSDFPTDIPVYPGIKFTLVSNDKAIPGYTGTTSDSVATVLAWYKAEYPKKGWLVQFETPNSLSVTKTGLAGGVAVNPPSDGVSEINVTKYTTQ